MLDFILGALVMLGLVWVRFRFFAFPAQRSEDYAGELGSFDIREKFNGALLCQGVIYGPTGRVMSRFVADFDAQWDGNRGVMKEDFRYESGSLEHREWTLSVEETGRITATAPDVIGTAQGRQAGPSVNLNYRLRLPEDAGGHVLDVRDWMYLTPDGTIVNRSQFRKYGLLVAELVATMRPKEQL
ncbi:DUF3833 family protein [Tropicibacter naphthalenivorans]|uniref:DUF3833 domain-containing protein n=1 Tax=Tropicibacter naphthalenivorans TaxID=441103 RepID=A0A0P1GES2_9RHOB|nr:DUF3833 family protein [Tropicibacter naphthalenivorans]CUH79931.1 hypothetical protein TRN7648_02719 [Tropicibacter naphthalenivorans]SMC76197.1 Protein of unknown function [Tropicibacter naphthalenivorans]